MTATMACLMSRGAAGFWVALLAGVMPAAAPAQEPAAERYRSPVVKRFMASDMSEASVSEILVPVLKAKGVPAACKQSVDQFLAFDATMRMSMRASQQSLDSQRDLINQLRQSGAPAASIQAVENGLAMQQRQEMRNAEGTMESFRASIKAIDRSCPKVN